MARYLWIALFCAAALPLAADDLEAQQRFAGTWQAKFKGAVFCTFKLKAGERISGAAYACIIHVNEQGELQEPEESDHPDTPEPILEPSIEGDTLLFAMADHGDERIKLSLRVLEDGVAELRFLNAPVQIKPIRFERK